MSEFLTAEDVRKLCGGAARRAAQKTVLTDLGLPFRIVGDTVLVSREHVRTWLGRGKVVGARAPNLGSVR